MKKKRSGGGGANWMDTYGDMVTLLLCFFVLLYSMSTISEESWKALVMSFNPRAVQITTATPGGQGPDAEFDKAGVMDTQDNPEGDLLKQEDIETMLETLYETLNEYSQQEGMQDSLSVEIDREAGKVYVTFNQTTFFDGYSAELRSESYPILDHVSEALSAAADAIEEVRIQGHTARDNPSRPNNPATDRKLSSDRAANVLIYIQPQCEVDPGRLISEGLGEWHPVADNETSEGRAQNRRVEMIISGRNIMEELDSDDVLSFNTQPST